MNSLSVAAAINVGESSFACEDALFGAEHLLSVSVGNDRVTGKEEGVAVDAVPVFVHGAARGRAQGRASQRDIARAAPRLM